MKKNTTLNKYLALIVTFFCAITLGFGQTILGAGDVVITGYNTENAGTGVPTEFSFVILTDIVATTEIKFTDRGWLTSGSFRAGNNGVEGYLTWTANTNLDCGTEVVVTSEDGFASTVTLGTIIEANDFELRTNGDQILVFQGPNAAPTHIYALNYNNTGWTTNVANQQRSDIPTGLTDGMNAVDIGGDNLNATYNCLYTYGPSVILASVSDVSNWYTSPLANTLGGCSFSCGETCATTTTWDGTAWDNGAPTITSNAIINGNYTTNAVNGSFSACSLDVLSGNLRINDGYYVEIENNVDATGNIIVESQGSFVQNNDSATVTATGNITVQKDTAILNSWLEYTYWSSPVQDDTVESALSNATSNRRFSFNAINFVDTMTEIGNTGVLIPGFDDIDDDGNDWQVASGVMTPGKGYASTGSQFGPFPASQQFTFSGAFNNGIVQAPIVNNSGGAYNDWNFIGNPYPSAIDTEVFFNSNLGLVNAIYLWSQATALDANASGNEGQNFSGADYAVISASGVNTAGASGIVPNNFVPSGQGFFVEALDAGNVTFNNSMRVTGDNTQFFRTTKKSKRNVLWINLITDNGVFNQIAIAHLNGASDGNDGSFYDVKRNVSANKSAVLYSVIEGFTDKFVIQGKNISSLTEKEVIKIGVKTSIETATIYTLSIAQLEGEFLSNSSIFVKDNLLQKIHNLKTSDYNFTSEVGEFNERFEIVFTEDALSLNDNEINENALSIIENKNGNVQFKLSGNLTMSKVQILDLQGRELYHFEAKSNDLTFKLSNLSQAPYIAKVSLSNGQVITKKAIKRY